MYFVLLVRIMELETGVSILDCLERLAMLSLIIDDRLLDSNYCIPNRQAIDSFSIKIYEHR